MYSHCPTFWKCSSDEDEVPTLMTYILVKEADNKYTDTDAVISNRSRCYEEKKVMSW